MNCPCDNDHVWQVSLKMFVVQHHILDCWYFTQNANPSFVLNFFTSSQFFWYNVIFNPSRLCSCFKFTGKFYSTICLSLRTSPSLKLSDVLLFTFLMWSHLRSHPLRCYPAAIFQGYTILHHLLLLSIDVLSTQVYCFLSVFSLEFFGGEKTKIRRAANVKKD